MRNLKTLSTLFLVMLCATSSLAFDLPTTAAVEVVEGITLAQTTQMDFGQVADHDGALALSDPNAISFDDTGYTPGIFTCTSIPAASVNCSFTDTDDVAGLNLSAWAVSVNGGADEGNLLAITQANAADTWNVGATLTVVAADAIVGVHAPGYTITVVLN
jgi:hypothetical protein